MLPGGGRGKFDWDRPEMKNIYRYLDVCQNQGITVILTDWGCEPGWLKVPGITAAAMAGDNRVRILLEAVTGPPFAYYADPQIRFWPSVGYQ